jgi:hypothetical protein
VTRDSKLVEEPLPAPASIGLTFQLPTIRSEQDLERVRCIQKFAA